MNPVRFLTLLLVCAAVYANAQTCSTCGSLGSSSKSNAKDTGPAFKLSLGNTQYGQPAGDLTFAGSIPDPALFTPAVLQFDASTRPDVNIITTNIVTTQNQTNYTVDASVSYTTNIVYFTNGMAIYTNQAVSANVLDVTNPVVTTTMTTNAVILQAQAPLAIADVPPPPTANGYVVDFYYPTNVIGTNSDGTCQFSGSPFITWLMTNSNPSGAFQLQVAEYGINPNYGLMKQWTYTYSNSTESWIMQTLGGLQESMITTNLDPSTYQVIDTFEDSYGNVVEQVANTYEIMDWSACTNVALVTNSVGVGGSAEVTTYTYWDPATFGAGSMVLPSTVSHPDGSWEYYNGYDTNGNPTDVFSAFEDVPSSSYTSGRETVYTYDPVAAGVSGAGDDGTFHPQKPRLTIEYINGNETSRRYAIFPSANTRLDVQCTASGAAWNAAGNLVTTNLFNTNGPNQFALMAVQGPDGTLSTYNYITNGTYRTNITVTGQPDSTDSYVVDGMSNVVVLNLSGYKVSSASYDVVFSAALAQDTYSDFDSYGRPQQVVHLDGTTDSWQYACCGLESAVNPDGAGTVYLYDSDKRQYGYETIYSSGSSNIITYQNTLDAVGHAVQSYRIGSDSSTITLSQSAYDTAGELVTQTNALGGITTYSRVSDPTTGGWIRVKVDPDGGVITNFYYADGSLKETVGSAVHSVRYVYGAGTDANGDACTTVEEIKLNKDGSDSSETTTTYVDMAGRTTEILYADGSYSQSFYNSQGQLSKQIDPDGVVNLYRYNGKGELAYSAVDLNQNGSIDFSGPDRITQTTNDVTTDHGTTVRRSRNYAWLDGSSTGTLVSSTENSTDGLDTWQTRYRDTSTAVTSHSHTAPGVSRTVTLTAPDGSYTLNTYSYGRLASSTRYDSTGAQIGGLIYGYDAQGRQNTTTDARNGTTTLGFNNADLVATNTTPNPGGGSAEVTTTAYNTMMQATNVTQPDATTVSSVYLLTGELGLQYGSRTYPVAYTYDYAGRMQTMTNWSNYAGNSGARVTTWNYDGQRGWLTSKTYDDGHGPSYQYTSAGRLKQRNWVRGVNTSYAYDTAGSLTNVSYSDSTPAVTNSYDRLGRLSSVMQNGITDTLTYNLANELLSESNSGGILNGLSVTNGYDQYLRRTTLSALSAGSQLLSANYGYDNASRLSTVTDGTNNAAYSYLANSPLVSQIVFKQNSTTRMTTTKSYDYLNRLTQISSAPSAAYTLPLTFNYTYNSANQRTHDTLADGSYWIYGYDSLGQVTNACKYFADGTPVAGQQFDYTFDNIGNRTQTLAGGDATGANLRVANYTNNSLNQITSRDIPAYVDVLGGSIFTNTVTVNGQTAYRKGEYFREQLPANNGAGALWTNVIVSGGQSVTGNVYVAKEPEVFRYDADGNLTNDGRFAYVWDGENRLIQMIVNENVGPQYQLTFAYDSKGRRIQKIVATNGVTIYTNNFLYDGWNLVALLNSQSSILQSFLWGSDLSGSMQGACGVGSLLEVSVFGSMTTNCFVGYDGNGNVVCLINAANGTVAANYEYGPFGEVIRATGPMAKADPFRFSTKYQDDESDLLYYGYRYYNDSTGRWLSTDPITEPGWRVVFSGTRAAGGASFHAGTSGQQLANLYGFVFNEPVIRWDLLGLDVNNPPTTVTGIPDTCPCKCGPSVDKLVSDTLKDVDAAFAGADPATQNMACAKLTDLSTGVDNWDMNNVLGVPLLPGQSPMCSSCVTKLTFGGGCYDPGDINYFMWGHICSLCSKNTQFKFDASSVEFWVDFAKRVRGKPVGCSAAIALSGFDGRSISCSGDASKVCKPSDKDATGNKSAWVWEPLRPRK